MLLEMCSIQPQWDEAIEIGAETGAPPNITLYQVCNILWVIVFWHVSIPFLVLEIMISFKFKSGIVNTRDLLYMYRNYNVHMCNVMC